MKSLIYTFILSASLILASCGPNLSKQNKELRDQVIAVHDEVMPKMGQLKALEKETQQKAEELLLQDSTQTEQVQALQGLAVELDQAYEGMFVWMRQYETEDGERTPEEVKVYLEDQMVKVTQVNEQIKGALSKADSLLKNQ